MTEGTHHVVAFLKCGAKIGIIFDITNISMNIFNKKQLFVILINSYIVPGQELSGVFHKDIQAVTG